MLTTLDAAAEKLELTLLRVECYLRRRQLRELAISASEYSGLNAQYRETIYLAVLSYLVQTGTASTSFKNEIKKAVVESFPDAFYAGYNFDGEQEVDKEDDSWLTARIGGEVVNIDTLFVSLKAIKDKLVAPSVYVDEANRRADGYAGTLDSVFSEGRLRGSRAKTLEFDGDDGEESCRTCQTLKGKKHKIKWIIDNDMIPRPGNEKFECNGYRCLHFWKDPVTGERWTF